MSNSGIQIAQSMRVLPTLESGRPLILESEMGQPAGLILQRKFICDLILPGSLVGGAIDARSDLRLIPIGAVTFLHPQTLEQKRIAYERRLLSIQWQQQLLSEPVPEHRVQKLLRAMLRSFGDGVLTTVSDDCLARIVGVLTETAARSRRQMGLLRPDEAGAA